MPLLVWFAGEMNSGNFPKDALVGKRVIDGRTLLRNWGRERQIRGRPIVSAELRRPARYVDNCITIVYATNSK